MKNLFVIVILFCFFTSCTPKVYVLSNGKKVSQKKLDRISDKASKDAWRSMSKEDRDMLNSIYYISVDTINVSGN